MIALSPGRDWYKVHQRTATLEMMKHVAVSDPTAVRDTTEIIVQ